MELYAAIDLHSSNRVLVILDETDLIVLQKRLQLLLTMASSAVGSRS